MDGEGKSESESESESWSGPRGVNVLSVFCTVASARVWNRWIMGSTLPSSICDYYNDLVTSSQFLGWITTWCHFLIN